MKKVKIRDVDKLQKKATIASIIIGAILIAYAFMQMEHGVNF